MAAPLGATGTKREPGSPHSRKNSPVLRHRSTLSLLPARMMALLRRRARATSARPARRPAGPAGRRRGGAGVEPVQAAPGQVVDHRRPGGEGQEGDPLGPPAAPLLVAD